MDTDAEMRTGAGAGPGGFKGAARAGAEPAGAVRRGPGDPRVARLAAGVGASLVVMALLHFSHVIAGGSPPYDPDAAGTAEAAIALVLLAAAERLRRDPGESRGFALGALVFAVAGFVLGLVFTVTGGTAIDVAYHSVGLPLLLLALRWQWRSPAK